MFYLPPAKNSLYALETSIVLFNICYAYSGSPRSFINPTGTSSNQNYSEMEMNHLLPGIAYFLSMNFMHIRFFVSNILFALEML